MIYGFAAGEFQFGNSSVIGHWMDRDDTPVSARNYAHEVFRYEETEDSDAKILDELDDFLGSSWHIEMGNERENGGYAYNYAVSDEIVQGFPFTYRRRVALIQKEHNMYSGWVEVPYAVPDRDIVEAAEGYQPRKVYQDCD